MTIVILGASGSGKSTIENELSLHHGYSKIVSYTTRKPREKEQNGKDYIFIDNEQFNEMKKLGLFAEYDEYSQGRMYGTITSDYLERNRVAVLTPNGFRKIRQRLGDEIFSVLVDADLGTRIIRYIERVGTDKFNFDDKNEICSRVERDFGMFLGLENEVDLVVKNNKNSDIGKIAKEIIEACQQKQQRLITI